MKTHKIISIISAGVLGIWLVGCGTTSTNAAGMTDEELATSIEARFAADPQLSVYDLDVDADAEDNTVTVSGVVGTYDQRNRAVEVAREGGSELIVEDNLEVDLELLPLSFYTEEMAAESRREASEMGDTLGDTLDDAWIHTKVRSKLAAEGELPFGGFNVDVADGVVTLHGQIDSESAKMRAEQIAADTGGVTLVNNELTVTPAE